MNWTPLTLDHLRAASLLGVVESLREEARARSLPDPWPAVPGQIADELRAAISFSGRALDAATASLPRSLLALTLSRTIREMKARLALPLTDDERDADKLYQRRLEQLTRGEWPVEPPDTPLTPTLIPTPSGHFASTAPVAL